MPQYKIKSGDTLSQIAKSKGFTLKQLKAANPKITDMNKIRAGATLQLPYSATGLMSRKKDVGTSKKRATKQSDKGRDKWLKWQVKQPKRKMDKKKSGDDKEKTKMMPKKPIDRRKKKIIKTKHLLVEVMLDRINYKERYNGPIVFEEW